MALELITDINSAIVLLFCALSAYQYIYILVSVLYPSRRFTARVNHRYAVLICARNEANVIENLIDSIKRQKYPAELLDIILLADNCTDNTAAVAAAAGARVYERYNTQKIGKGFALDELFAHIREDFADDYYEGFFIFDADNLLAPDYVAQMNAVFDNGYRVVTSYRNSKNFDKNWISAGYGLMFMREARHMNNARMILHTSCAVSGTGYLVHRDVVWEKGGWPFNCLTEDLEFTMDMIGDGEKIGYCHDAVFYDEQPVRFRQSWTQRIRWAKGFVQAILRKGGKILRGIFHRKSSFSCFDEIMSTLPTLVLSIFGGVSVITMLASLFFVDEYGFREFITAFLWYFISIYLVNFIFGLLTMLTEWKKIHCSFPKRIVYLFTFPIFMLTNIPINIVALFVRGQWKPIAHSDTTSIAEIDKK